MSIFAIKLFLRRLFHHAFKPSLFSLLRLTFLPRYRATSTTLFGKSVKLPDAPSFLWMQDEIFMSEIYRFNTSSPRPLILDCGANIGLSVIYFKRLYSSARVIAFEPDDQIFDTLSYNVGKFGFKDVELLKKGVWNEQTTLQFAAEGADGGRIAQENSSNMKKIETVRLRDYLDQPVALLKIDIEGAETAVLRDCADALGKVANIFVEYHSFDRDVQTLDEILSILTRNGFRYYLDSAGMRSPHPFIYIKKNLNMDLQINIWGYRVDGKAQ